MARVEKIWRLVETAHTIVWICGLLVALGVVTLIGTTIAELRHSFIMSTIVIVDVIALLLLSLGLVGVALYARRREPGAKAIGTAEIGSEQAARAAPLSVIDVYPENSVDEKIIYKFKVRIELRNETKEAINVRRGYWVANGNVSLQLPPRLAFRVRTDKGNWSAEVSGNIYINPGQDFSTWIGLYEKLSDERFRQVKNAKEFGTLALEIEGNDSRQELRI